MTEVRARAARHKGQLNFEQDLKIFLYAFGDDPHPLSETVRILDELVTDFLIETCHTAARAAAYSNRQKIKVDDFKFAIRGNEMMLGRLQELVTLQKEIQKARAGFEEAQMAEGKANLNANSMLLDDGDVPKKRGRKRKAETDLKSEAASVLDGGDDDNA